jgi:hypothetical protein
MEKFPLSVYTALGDYEIWIGFNFYKENITGVARRGKDYGRIISVL